MLFIIAWRNLWRNRTRSLTIIVSVVLGIWAGLLTVALYYGMGRDRVRIAIKEEISHIQIHHPQFGEDYEAKFHFPLDEVELALAGVENKEAYSIRSIAQGMIANASGSNGVQIYGIDPEAEDQTRGLAGMVREGTYFSEGKSNRVLVGYKLAKKMNLEPKDKVVLTFIDAGQNTVSAAFRVSGIYESSNSILDELNVYVRRDKLNELLGTTAMGHEAAVLMNAEEHVSEARRVLKAQLPDLLVQDWREVSPETAYIISAIGSSSRVIMIIIILALAFGIVNTMLMAVLERTREIGMLMAVGMSKPRIFGMVVLETLMLTLVGSPVGVAVSLLTVQALSKNGIDLSVFFGQLHEILRI
jgi:putative ABC transport system permease protein